MQKPSHLREAVLTTVCLSSPSHSHCPAMAAAAARRAAPSITYRLAVAPVLVQASAARSGAAR